MPRETDSPGVERFARAVVQMPTLLTRLRAARAWGMSDLRRIPKVPGIYLLSDADGPVYAGQTRSLHSRLKQQTVASSRQESASLAFDIAKREATRAGLDTARYRRQLERDPDFVERFARAKSLVAAMQVQFIELHDPVARHLFEPYAVLALGTVESSRFESSSHP